MTRNEKRHQSKVEYEFSSPLGAILRQVISDEEKELAVSKVQEWVYAKEAADPVHVGKLDAEERLGLYQKHSRAIEEKIAIIRLFLTEKGL